MIKQASAEDNMELRDVLCLAGGVALIALGAGCILANTRVRRALLGDNSPLAALNESLGGVIPDVERYLKMKSM